MEDDGLLLANLVNVAPPAPTAPSPASAGPRSKRKQADLPTDRPAKRQKLDGTVKTVVKGNSTTNTAPPQSKIENDKIHEAKHEERTEKKDSQPPPRKPQVTSEQRKQHLRISQQLSTPRTIIVKDEDLFADASFDSYNLDPHLVKHLKEHMHIERPTHIQHASLPVLLGGRDLLMKAETGSGKTLAYLLPMIQDLQSHQPKIARTDGTYALIIAPTRELAHQIHEVLSRVVRACCWLVPGLLIGGEKKKSEKARLRRGITILVATPGRLLDHLNTTAAFSVQRLRWLVLDEADRLLDMGFEKDVSEILRIIGERTPQPRRSALVSATLNEGVHRLAGISLSNPVIVDLVRVRTHSRLSAELPAAPRPAAVVPLAAPVEDERPAVDMDTSEAAGFDERAEHYATPRQLQQQYSIVPAKKRLCCLAAVVASKARLGKVVVFVACCDAVEFLYMVLSAAVQPTGTVMDATQLSSPAYAAAARPLLGDTPVFKLHGSMTQVDRTSVYAKFVRARAGVLLCTDVGARGLDLPDVRCVVQYDPPCEMRDYIHRVGRTARMGQSGESLLFLMPSEVAYVELLREKQLALQEVPFEAVLLLLRNREKTASAQPPQPAADTEPRRRRTLPEDVELQLFIEQLVSDSDQSDFFRAACCAFRSFIRSYATYPASYKHVFHVRNLHLGHVAKSFGLRSPPSQLPQFPGVTAAQKSKQKKPPRTDGAQRETEEEKQQRHRKQAREKKVLNRAHGESFQPRNKKAPLKFNKNKVMLDEFAAG